LSVRLSAFARTLLIALIGSVASFGVLQAQDAPPPEVELLIPEILSIRPHDPNAYTQGLLLYEGAFYESTGRYGQSTLREVDPATGEVSRQHTLPATIFAEGLALVDDRLIQITWQEGIALVYDLETFRLRGVYPYEGEGWGLCYDGESLYMSDGSDVITRRAADDFRALDAISVTFQGEPVVRLNELECVGDSIWANVWQTNFIVRIDKGTGVITAVVDASNLQDPELMPDDPQGVLNGIAYDEENDVFLITGKLWSQLYEVTFVDFED
jgi:glutamine cyclotransferase